MSVGLAPFPPDRGTAAEFLRGAIRVRSGDDSDTSRWEARELEELRAGRTPGRLVTVDAVPAGVAVWKPERALGLSIEFLYLDPTRASSACYGQLLSELERTVGPVAFVGGPLAGVAEEETRSMMTERGFLPFGRSEMRWPPGRAVPEIPESVPARLRASDARDAAALVRLHSRAYRGTLDRFLFYQDADDERNARAEVLPLLDGTLGPLEVRGSWCAEREGELVAAVLTVRTEQGFLITDVMVDPIRQRQGLGRAVLAAAVRSMLEERLGPIYLNVTEGNEPALRLYRRLGFVRSLGPSSDWYSTALVPIGRPGPPTDNAAASPLSRPSP